MMRMTCSSYASFKKMLTRAYYEAFVTMVERKRGATTTITKTVPLQRSGSGNSIEIPMQRRSVWLCVEDGGALPDTGCHTSWRQGNE